MNFKKNLVTLAMLMLIAMIVPIASFVSAAPVFTSDIELTSDPAGFTVAINQELVVTATWENNPDVKSYAWLIDGDVVETGQLAEHEKQGGSRSYTFSSATDGTFTITFRIWHDQQTARDASDSEDITVTATVTYKFSGFFKPLVEDGCYKAGSTIPVKFQILDSEGNPVTDTEIVSIVFMEDESYTPGSIPIDDIVDAGNAPATGGTQFRYDSTAQQYIFK